MKPQIWIISGPNGSGKSTLTSLHGHNKLPMVNPDDIAKELAQEDIASVAIKAGKTALKLQKEYLCCKKSFMIETTLSGKHELSLMIDAKSAGYKVNFVYVGVDNPAVSMGRVNIRVKDGGHFVPWSDVTRRYTRSMQNLPAALKLADRAFILDNSQKRYRLLFTVENNIHRHITKSFPDWAAQLKIDIHNSLVQSIE